MSVFDRRQDADDFIRAAWRNEAALAAVPASRAIRSVGSVRRRLAEPQCELGRRPSACGLDL